MEFYCPQCQQVVTQDSEKKITTKANRQVAMANCLVCNQEMTSYGVEQKAEAITDV